MASVENILRAHSGIAKRQVHTLAYGELREKNRTAFCPSPTGKMPTKT